MITGLHKFAKLARPEAVAGLHKFAKLARPEAVAGLRKFATAGPEAVASLIPRLDLT